METRLQKWGNSFSIKIPSTILKSLNIKNNDILNIIQEENRIIITIKNKRKVSLARKFEEYNGENLAKEFSWDDACGREIW